MIEAHEHEGQEGLCVRGANWHVVTHPDQSKELQLPHEQAVGLLTTLQDFYRDRNLPPLHVRCVVPKHAAEAYRTGDYSPWYVGHRDYALLVDEFFLKLFDHWQKRVDQSESGDFESFMAWLGDSKRLGWEGYTVFQSGPEGFCQLEVP